MKLSRSSCYYQPRGRRKGDEGGIVAHIEAVCDRWPGYGYRRVTRQLAKEGRRVNHKRVARIVREQGLQARSPRAFVTNSDGGPPSPFPNLAKGFVPTGPDQLWVADLTYIRILVGFVDAAVILDSWSRRVVGYAIARHMDVRLTCAVLQAAIAARTPPTGCIHHSDRGSQYGAEQYRALLTAHGLQGSMGRRGNPYDNAQAESFIKTMNYEEIYLKKYQTFRDVVDQLPRFIDEIYNAERMYSVLGYLSPAEFEEGHDRLAA